MIIINKQFKPDQTKNKKRNELLLLNERADNRERRDVARDWLKMLRT